MKKIAFLFLTLFAVCMVLVSCGGDNTPTPTTYKITFDSDGGASVAAIVAEGGVEIAIPTSPTKEGYKFIGWYLGDAEYVFSVMPEVNITLKAKWEKLPDPIKEYTLTLDVNGGNSLSNNSIIAEAGATITLPTPTKEGYNFLGWYKGETKFEENIMPDENITLVAKWEEIIIPVVKYTITFDVNGGNSLTNSTFTAEAGAVIEFPNPVKDGYEFLGWYTENEKFEKTTMPEENITLVAKWSKVIVYSDIVYNLDGGVNPNDAPSQYEEGKELTLPTPTKEGHSFLGWSLQENSTTYITKIYSTQKGIVTLYANWEENSQPEVGDPFEIDYELNGGAWKWTAGTVTDAAKGIDAVSNLPEVFMADFYTYLFENNLLNSSKVSTKIQVNNWHDFSKNNGDPVALYNTTSTVKTGAADGYSELFFDSLNGYEAIGGFLGTSPYKEKYANLTKHMIQLTKIKYPTVAETAASFKAGCGFVLDGYFYGTQGLLASSKENYQTFNTLRATIPSTPEGYVVTSGTVGTAVKLVAPVKEGHMFLGWYLDAECKGEKVTSVTSGCKLYASWQNLNAVYNINYVLDGGTNSYDAPKQFTYGKGVILTKPSKEGYIFVGWSTDPEGTNLITEISIYANSDITVYANWAEGEDDVYTITYVYTDGNLPTRTPSSVAETIEYVFTSYYNWLKPSDDYQTFKTKVIAQWKDGQSQGNYKFYKQNGKDQIDDNYFCNATENFDEWNAWFTVFDAQVTAANGAQNAWNSYVGILRLGQWLSNNPPVTWKDSMNQALIAATKIKIPLVTEYKLGDEIELTELVINDGREFLGWYDQNGNKVEKINSNTKGNLVLTAKWTESVPVETFEVTNQIDRLLKFSKHQLSWSIGPNNATLKKVTFVSTNEEVLTVSEKGLIEAVGTGTAKVLITVHGNTALNMELEIEVYVDPYIDGEFIEESYVVVNDAIQLAATVHGAKQENLVWKSNTPSIATVSNDGVVSGGKEGLAEIVAYCSDNEEISFTFYVTVLESNPTGILKLLLDSNNKEIYTEEDLLIGIKIGSDGAYYSDVIGSVSKLLFEDYVVHEDYYLSNPSNKSNYSTGGIQFITVHYAADMPYSASAMYNGGKNLASYNKSCNTNGTQASWHYSVGNDGIWYSQNEAYGAWHAGSSKTMTWTDSGLTTSQVGSDLYSTDVTLGKDGYFYIKGVKTNVKNTTSGTKLNGMGLAVKVDGSKVYLGGHYYNTSYGYISSTGGNNNSIGMETSVREGSDLWLTWQYTAQLCAKLLLKYNLPLNRLVGHHFFSGKWCPQPMLENNLEIWYEFVELTRQQMDLYENYSNYTLSFNSSSSYLKDNGRVAKLPNYPECATYTVTYTVGSTTKTITLSSILPGVLE